MTWVTFNMTEDSVVEYGSRGLDSKARGVQDTFVDAGAEKRVLYIHRVKLTGLTPGQGYGSYSVCSYTTHQRNILAFIQTPRYIDKCCSCD